MVCISSVKISRVPSYSGNAKVHHDYAYGALTLYRWPSQIIQLSITYLTLWSVTPILRLVWAVPLSLAATYGIDFLSFPLGTKMFQFPRCAFSSSYWFLLGWRDITHAGFPHSEINGSKLISSSPSLFAGNRVLHRLLVPRHPLYALINLTS